MRPSGNPRVVLIQIDKVRDGNAILPFAKQGRQSARHSTRLPLVFGGSFPRLGSCPVSVVEFVAGEVVGHPQPAVISSDLVNDLADPPRTTISL